MSCRFYRRFYEYIIDNSPRFYSLKHSLLPGSYRQRSAWLSNLYVFERIKHDVWSNAESVAASRTPVALNYIRNAAG